MMFTLRTARVSGNTIFQCIWEGSATWAGPSELFHLITSVTVTKRLEYFCNILFLFSYSVISNSLWHYGLSASSVAQSGPTFCKPINCSMPGLLVHHQLPEFTQTHVHWVSDAIQPSHPLLFPSPPAPIPPGIRVFSNESALRMRWPKYWRFSFSISPSNERPGLISFRRDWLDLLAVHGILKSLLQHHSQKHQFFGAQLSL